MSANSGNPRYGVGFCVAVGHTTSMLLAYIDEIGEPGAFISRSHSRYNTSAAFGYAGFIIPASRSREFGAIFTSEKQTLFKHDHERAEHSGRWEKKGADIFRPQTANEFPHYLRVYDSLVRKVRDLGGSLFYYADEKPLGSPKLTELNTTKRESDAMSEALNRIARHADKVDNNVMIIMDQINEKTRTKRLQEMYGHILGRASDHKEMRRIIEPPMHVDSILSSNIQFADWTAACVSRAIEYQLVRDSPYKWTSKPRSLPSIRGSFTLESKLHLWHKSINDFHHSELFYHERPLHVNGNGRTVGEAAGSVMHKIMASAVRQSKHTRNHD